MDDLQRTVSIIRTYNNFNPIASVERAIEQQIGKILVVVNDEDVEHRGSIRRWLEHHVRQQGDRLVIIEIRDGYGWAKALNAAFTVIRRLRMEGDDLQYLLPTSTFVRWTCAHLENMFQLLQSEADIGLVAPSFSGFSVDTEQPEALGPLYLRPRFTFMLLRFDALQDIGGVEEVCDSFGGMEDYDFVVRLATCSRWQWRRINLHVPIGVGFYEDQREKEKRCINAIRRIQERLLLLSRDDARFHEAMLQAIQDLG